MSIGETWDQEQKLMNGIIRKMNAGEVRKTLLKMIDSEKDGLDDICWTIRENMAPHAHPRITYSISDYAEKMLFSLNLAKITSEERINVERGLQKKILALMNESEMRKTLARSVKVAGERPDLLDSLRTALSATNLPRLAEFIQNKAESVF